MRIPIAFAILIVFITAGCLTPPQNLGCCLKVNATDPSNPGCILYNTTSYLTTDAYFASSLNKCNNITGCNVTIGNESHLIPLCTGDQIVSCISPDCQALVCGDFNYKPRVAPGFTSIDQAGGNAPPDLNKEGAALQFYKARCVYLPLDSQLRQIMQNSKSQIDVFRMGVGGSFDEFDQYKYYFPISDKYCNINPTRTAGDTRVDRYMNYLQGDLSAYDDPLNGITADCVQDPTSIPPLGFSENASSQTTTGVPGVGSFTYNQVVPDKSNYKFATYGRLDLFDTWESEGNFYYYNTPSMRQDSVYKKVDDAFYRKYLSIAHASLIYGLTPALTTRAPFECDAAANDCYSGSCDTQTYNRGVMLKKVEGVDAEVVTDCNQVSDENGQTRVICAPTTNVVVSGTPGTPPNRNYANVNILPMHIETAPSSTFVGTDHYPTPFTSIQSSPSTFDAVWDGFNTSEYQVWETGTDRVTNKVLDSISFYITKKKYCTWDYGANNDSNTSVVCSSVSVTSDTGPPAGGAVFFGKLKDDKTVTYRGNTIIGYALASSTDFPNLMLVNSCGLNMSPILPSRPNSTDGHNSCVTSCTNACTGSGVSNLTGKCNNWCDPTQSSPPAPCTPPAASSNSSVIETQDFVRVDLKSLSDPQWNELMSAFKPYFDDRINAIGNKGVSDCGGSVDPSDLAVSSMPWVINYEKGLNSPSISLFGGGTYNSSVDYGLSELTPIGYHMSSTAAQALRTRNIFDESMSTARGTSACELGQDAYWWFSFYGNSIKYYYSLAFSRYIYLFKYNSSTQAFGQCEVDDNTRLPKMKTFGWCQACTTSTLAYQNITTYNRVYMPQATMKIQGPVISNYADICSSQYNPSWSGWFDFRVTDNVSCFNSQISDVSDYKESIGAIGSPRTSPEATILKERLGNYLKSGVMPVLDISDNSNWNLTNPDSGDSGFCLFYFGCGSTPNTYAQYDFERLFGNMGAVVAIVDHVGSPSDVTQAKLDEIINRTTEVHDRCFGCLTAVHVDTPTDNVSFGNTIAPIITDPLIRLSGGPNGAVDLITFDYPLSSHTSVSAMGPQAIVDDITSYGRTSLQIAHVPTMVVGFNVKNNDGTLSSANFTDVFDTIVQNQDELVKAGVMGIIYSPARGSAGNDNTGIVDVSGGVGSKTAKFCALQGALYKMSTIPPNALFTRVTAINATQCVLCNSLEKDQGVCGPPSGQSVPVCDNGNPCDLPPAANAADYKCPDQTIVGSCTLCQNEPGTFSCIKTYANGTSVPVTGSMSDLTSDLYLDVVAAIPKPKKCCLQIPGGNGTNTTLGVYTYTEQSFSTPLNKPLVFPKSGDPNVDCGFGSSIDVVNQLANFCNIQNVPLKNYNITCNVSGY